MMDSNSVKSGVLSPYRHHNAQRRVFAFFSSQKKPTSKKVEEAIAAIQETGEEGASLIAIMNYILHHYPTSNVPLLKNLVKRTIVKGINSGVIVRTQHSKKAQGISGSFTFPAKKKLKKEKQSLQEVQNSRISENDKSAKDSKAF